MTLKPKGIEPVPAETARVAKAAFPKGNVYLTLRDALNLSYNDEDFQDLFPQVGQAAESPSRLALITVLQFAEGLSDRQAADAVRSRIDWKYLLGLELEDSGFNFSVLSEFRKRLIAGGAEEHLLNHLLVVFKTHHLLKERGRQRTDATHVQAAVRRMNRLEKVGETLRAALNDLAELDPDWLRARLPLDWYARYGTRIEAYRLPKATKEQQQLGVQIGEDGYQVLSWVYAAGTADLRKLPSVEILRRVWLQEYYQQDDETIWRDPKDLPPSEKLIDSPYDPEAHYAEKRGQGWLGYKAHLTETCDEDCPHLVVQVETSPATQNDSEALPTIYEDLADKNLLPSEHIIDQGYINSRHVVTAKTTYAIDTVGIPMPDSSWQARANQGFDLAHFVIDWEQQILTCPMQQTSQLWYESHDSQGKPLIRVEFSKQCCHACFQRIKCTKNQTGGRKISFRPKAEYEALQQLRQQVQTEVFKARYRKRAGIEGTLSQAVRGADLRRARYLGLAKVHLQHVATAAAINLARVFAWLSDVPLAKTRSSPLAALLPLAS